MYSKQMERGFRLFPEQASTAAVDVDRLYFFVLAVSGFFVLLIAGAILYFAIRYRRKHLAEYPKPILGIVMLEITWSVIPLGITLMMFAWGAKLFFRVQTIPQGALEIYVVGKQWMWKIQHAGGRREINELHVPVGWPVKLNMISEDVIHSFYVPAFRVKQDVLPGRYTAMWFEASKPGQYHLFCAEYCGTKHSGMIGRVIALEPVNYQRWLAGELDAPPLADQGRWAFERFRCVACHGTRDNARLGPSLAGRFGSAVHLADGRVVPFDADYVRESILQPRQKTRVGFPEIMPTYLNQIGESEIQAIIEYLKSGS